MKKGLHSVLFTKCDGDEISGWSDRFADDCCGVTEGISELSEVELTVVVDNGTLDEFESKVVEGEVEDEVEVSTVVVRDTVEMGTSVSDPVDVSVV